MRVANIDVYNKHMYMYSTHKCLQKTHTQRFEVNTYKKVCGKHIKKAMM